VEEDPLGFVSQDFNLYRYVFNYPTDLSDPLGLAAATEYGTLTSRVAANRAFINCLKGLSVELVGDVATAGVYLFLANGKVYAGRSNNPDRRFREHERRLKRKGIEIVRDSFRVFNISASKYKAQLPRVRQLEQSLINIIKSELDPSELLNRRNEIRGGKSPCN